MDIFVFEDERKFETVDGEGKTFNLKIVKPTQEQISQADLRYKIKFSQALRMGAMTKAQAEKFIRDNDLLDDETSQRRDEIIAKISILRDDISEEIDKDNGIKVIKEISALRAELDNIHSISMDIMNQTSEAYAEDFRIQWLCSELTMKEDGARYFEDYEDFAKSISDVATADEVKNLILFLNNLKDNFEMEFEENKWLLDKQIINKNGTINLDGLFDDIEDKKDEGKVSSKTSKSPIKKKSKAKSKNKEKNKKKE